MSYNDASIIITPNGFKAGKLYAVKGADLTVTRATGANRINPSGANETMGANIPRLDYTNSTCPSILVEPQRTNLALRSEEFDNAVWTKLSDSSVVSNSVISPNGTLTADTLNFNSSIGSRVEQSVNLTTTGNYTFSFYGRADSNKTVGIRTGISGSSTFNVTLTSEWQRFSVTQTLSVAGLAYPQIRSIDSSGGNIYIWGAQLEAGSNATSYIPTVASAVTRNADVISKTGISSLIGQTEGTLYANVKFNSLGSLDSWLTISSNTNANWIFIGKASNKIRAYVKGNGIVVFDNQVTNITSGQFMKIAIAYKTSDIALYINGSLIATSTNSLTFSAALSLLALDSSNGTSENTSETTEFQEILIFPTRLLNADLATLTTL
jgi:uncharacterized protein YaiE (UPF0345 family)